jgi:hypothetical protein
VFYLLLLRKSKHKEFVVDYCVIDEREIGSEVYWNDPDDGGCSGWRIIQELKTEDVVVLSEMDGTGYTEAYIHELT